MVWTAPSVSRREPPWDGDERTVLTGWLEFQRETLLFKCAGLDAVQLRTRATPPSNLSLLGLVRHMAEVERVWFRVRIAGEPIGDVYCTEDDPDFDFEGTDSADPERDFETFRSEVELAGRVQRGRSLDESYTSTRRSGQTIAFNLRGVLVHMIEEYARHNGHADLLRERIDGIVGD